MKLTFKDLTNFIIISGITYILWVGLELLYYGEIQPRIVDTFIGMVLNASIFLNYKLLKGKK